MIITAKSGECVLQDEAGDEKKTKELQAKVVVNASGPWTDDMRAMIGTEARLRKQRGSHLVFPYARLPLDKAVTLFHPRDRRALFAIPWEGVTLIGTTDLDHDPDESEINNEPFASTEEIEYLIECASDMFPAQNLTIDDVLSTFAGIRPIIKTGADLPSKESRAHAVWVEKGMITITGGKLTTFRIMARQVLEQISKIIPPRNKPQGQLFDKVSVNEYFPWESQSDTENRVGRIGSINELEEFIPDEMGKIPQTQYKWADLRRAACREYVVHLDDLLLRRVRLGLVSQSGGKDLLPKIRAVCQTDIGMERRTLAIRREPLPENMAVSIQPLSWESSHG